MTGGADEIGWDDLIRRVSKAITDTGQYGARGAVSFPPEVEVAIAVEGEGAAKVAREFVQRPAFDREVGARLENRCDCSAADLPLRSYEVSEGPRLHVRVAIRAAGTEARWSLVVEGGDLDGQVLKISPTRPELRFGRGPWHGGDRQVTNDLVICEDCPFVSRRAGRLLLSGHLLEVESLDQGDLLAVRRASGDAMRPARSASGRLTLRAGDAIELTGGEDQTICLRLDRRRA